MVTNHNHTINRKGGAVDRITVGAGKVAMKSIVFAAATVLTASPLCSAFVPPTLGTTAGKALGASFGNHNDERRPSDFLETTIENVGKVATGAMLALALSFSAVSTPGDVLSTVPSANAADGKAIGLCLLKKCRLPLAKCITNPNCLANVICINTCNGKADEEGCQIECGNSKSVVPYFRRDTSSSLTIVQAFENDVVGEFNKCAVSDMTCVPKKADDGSYPVPSKENVVQSFDTSLFNGRWYITAGQNKLFDTFPCQVHFFTSTAPGEFYGKMNWRIQEPDGEYFTRDALQSFVQDPKNPARLVNDGNEYLHYTDDWYIIDYAKDGNKEGTPPFAFVYYRGDNDAWSGYGGVVVYTRDASLPESLRPRLREAAKKVNFDFDKDFTVTDNTCTVLSKGEQLVLREKFAGKVAIQTEKQLQQQAVLARTAATNSIQGEVGVAEKVSHLYLTLEPIDWYDRIIRLEHLRLITLSYPIQALERIESKAVQFEKELAKDAVGVEKELVKDVVNVEKEIVKDVVQVEKEIVKDVVGVEKVIETDVDKLIGSKQR